MNRTFLATAASLVFLGPAFCQAVESATPPTTGSAKTVANAKGSHGFRPLSGNWESASFGGDGAIDFKKVEKPEAEQGTSGGKAPTTELIELATGDPLTGIRWTGPLMRENYELRLQARRVEGFDFFVAVTFPVGDEHCSFVVGGWGGGLLGISSIDGNDAANNETTQFKDFKKGQWYAIRIRVDNETMKCWIDDEEWVNVNREDHGFDIRIEMDPCLPLGIANFQCVSEIKGVEIRKLSAEAK